MFPDHISFSSKYTFCLIINQDNMKVITLVFGIAAVAIASVIPDEAQALATGGFKCWVSLLSLAGLSVLILFFSCNLRLFVNV